MRRLITMAGLMTLLLASPAPRWAPVVRPAMAQYEQSAAGGATGGDAERSADQERRRAKSRFRYLLLGYGLIWVSLGYYLFDLNRRVALVGRDIDELKGRLDLVQGPRRR